jgi:hypothetical protein
VRFSPIALDRKTICLHVSALNDSEFMAPVVISARINFGLRSEASPQRLESEYEMAFRFNHRARLVVRLLDTLATRR